MKYIKIALIVAIGTFCSCKKYLDVVPDNVATIENAFKLRVNAEQFLFTCYSYLPKEADYGNNPAFLGSDEIWHYDEAIQGFQIAKGNQNVNNPILNTWDGGIFVGIRDCNTFLENISKVKDMTQFEKERWVAEVKFLKAYYHFYLVRMYGPIPLVRKNLPISASVEEVQVERDPLDECVDYIVELLDEAAISESLPLTIEDQANELGRITKPVVLALKAKILVTAASPLFNGNTDYANFTNKDGTKLFNSTYDPKKWESAVNACKEAIDMCHSTNHKLYTYDLDQNSAGVSPETYYKMSTRNSLTAKWNPEIIWSNQQTSTENIQRWAVAKLDASSAGASTTGNGLAPTLKMAELFYTKNGLPINEDKTWNYAGRYSLRTATTAEKNNILENYQTAALHFEREPRFYGSLAFDGSIWYGQGKLSEAAPWFVQAKLGQFAGGQPGQAKYSVTGYWPQKLVNYLSTYSTTAGFIPVIYPWPMIRLADLYLLYAEALNEHAGPNEEVYEYLNKVRIRAGLPTVQDSWSTQYTTNTNKYSTQNGLREIIHRERSIELAFEGSRFWDLRRWKTATDELNSPVYGWNVAQETAASYYKPRLIFNQEFRLRDYFWPIKQYDLIVNQNLVQNPGW